ncbi:protein of unknown function (plasmid) [Denitratisoma oestradiolicum]|uniref:Uncharacterized protein n=1 Tax=Denitratisoma oestradiolicum TaxID=311182 RepID=A0A6S6XZ21_9PROT|nr:protein of unknown function [Denitratisoma oestradiolicum]
MAENRGASSIAYSDETRPIPAAELASGRQRERKAVQNGLQNLTGDYLWRSSAKVGSGKFRPLQSLPKP